MSWASNGRDVTVATDKEVEDYYLDWHDGMNHAFNGRAYPSEYPRADRSISHYTLSGNHLTFYQFEAYYKERML